LNISRVQNGSYLLNWVKLSWLKQSQDRKMKDRKIAFDLMPEKLTMPALPQARDGMEPRKASTILDTLKGRSGQRGQTFFCPPSFCLLNGFKKSFCRIIILPFRNLCERKFC
jgi:hypothetical protein